MELYVIAGPNGAGKTTFAHEFLPKYADCKNFVNADLIAQAMAPFSPETAAFRAGRMMLDEMHAFANRRVSFAFETILSGRGYLPFLRRLKAEGYQVHIFFLSLTRGACTSGTSCPPRKTRSLTLESDRRWVHNFA
jgi:predicted ABC-type ATPase